MSRNWGRLAGLAAVFLLFTAPLSAAQAPEAPLAARINAFDRYIAKKDPVYAWKLNSTLTGPGYTAYVLRLTSQSWRSDHQTSFSSSRRQAVPLEEGDSGSPTV